MINLTALLRAATFIIPNSMHNFNILKGFKTLENITLHFFSIFLAFDNIQAIRTFSI